MIYHCGPVMLTKQKGVSFFFYSSARLFLVSDASELELSDTILPALNEEQHTNYQKRISTQVKPYTSSNCLSVNLLPEMFRSIFPFSQFNAMQSKSFDAIYKKNDNCVISSPTGSGKTVLFEIAIIKLLEARSNQSDDSLLNAKILYMAPTKALCNERYADWCSKFQPLNCAVGILTGDSPFVELDSIRKSDLIICTPEKWDVLTRRWADYSKLLNLVKLLLVDEIHILREKRGTSLEVVITRMMSMPLSLRIIALSATVPNINDVANWLGKSHDSEKSTTATTLVYDDTYRAVSLGKTVYGYQTMGTSNPFKFEGFLNGKLPEVIRLHSKGKPTLIFCSTRNSTVTTAKALLQGLNNPNTRLRNIPSGVSRDLLDLAQQGVAYHHAGLSWNERKFVEENFIIGSIKILCSTSTLAVGVNLPAYLVIIKGTKAWNNNSLEEYNELDLLQMMGRAGRPQFETKGVCVIMTDAFNKERYIRLAKGTENLESSLHLNLHENITAEITLKTINTLGTAFTWLKSTFFYQCYLHNPAAYPTVFKKFNSRLTPEAQLKVFLKRILSELEKEQMIEIADGELNSTSYGIAMSKSYVLYETMKKFIKSGEKLSLQDSLLMISESDEFKDIRVKLADKKLFKDINSSPLILNPIKDNKIEKFHDKVSLLIQFELGGVEYPMYQGSMKLHHEFISEKLLIFKSLPRILKAAVEVFSHRKDAISLASILKLTRCIYAKSWENSFLVLRQVDGIGLTYAKKLESRGITDIDQLKSLTGDKLEYYLGIKAGAGQKIAKSIASIPELSLRVENIKCESSGTVQFDVAVDLFNTEDNISYIWNGSFAHINVLTNVSGRVWDFRRLPLKKLVGGEKYNLKVDLGYKSDYIKVYLNCDEIAGLGKTVELDTFSATECLGTRPSSRKKGQSFDFDDDDEVLRAIFGNNSIEENSKKKLVDMGVTRTPQMEFADSSDASFSTVSTSTDSSFTECNHKCSDKSTCRHICCKHGIPKQKIKLCKHVCKDKSKCRHMCCRDQFDYETRRKSKIERKRMRQNTFDFAQCATPNKSFTSVVITENIIGKADDLSDGNPLNCEPTASNNKGVPLVKDCPTKMPVFLKKVNKPLPVRTEEPTSTKALKDDNSELGTESKYGKLKTSRFFKTSIRDSGMKRNRGLLDMSDSDEFSDTFDSALDKALKRHKRVKPIPKKDSSKKRDEAVFSKTTRAADMIILSNSDLPKLQKVYESGNSSQLDSAEDIIIVNQTLPKVIPVRKLYPLSSSHDSKNNQVTHYADNGGGDAEDTNTGCSGEDTTAMTSVMEEAVNKEIFGFLDSDIEFDS